MSITTARKADLIKTYAVKSDDTGSPEVQVALLSQRRQILDYLRRNDDARYKELIERLGIRR